MVGPRIPMVDVAQPSGPRGWGVTWAPAGRDVQDTALSCRPADEASRIACCARRVACIDQKEHDTGSKHAPDRNVGGTERKPPDKEHVEGARTRKGEEV